MDVSTFLVVLCLCLGLVGASEESPSSLQQLLEKLNLLKQDEDAEPQRPQEGAGRAMDQKKGTNERTDQPFGSLLDERKREASKQGTEVSNAHESGQGGLDDIMAAMHRRSETTSQSLREVFREVADSYRHLENGQAKRASDPTGCDPNPCAHNEPCSTSDVPEGATYVCGPCQEGFSGLDCGVYDPCFYYHTSPWQDEEPPCGKRMCFESSNEDGYFCF